MSLNLPADVAAFHSHEREADALACVNFVAMRVSMPTSKAAASFLLKTWLGGMFQGNSLPSPVPM